MGYADKLKLNSSKIKTEEKVLKEKTPTKKKNTGRPKKAIEEVRNTAIPVALSQKEKDWIEEQALKMSKEIGVKITTSAWMRMTLLKDMIKEEN
ncbi:MAG: hypothetical protein AB7S49_06640 [Arcobacter sp.]|jgi:hypothetical protein|uniref:Uncharacterized protein n=1 Tax=Arcobacter defluvii TaxID=873191 RepID=A0AAE7BII5_9BACT|nr:MULTISPECIES: hypothetical protein [Arcobacter]QKF78527.1 hypothetical protein ADFLV_2544 [Arcobacter defluvii]RXI31278.1 hypothetical protein CP964_10065 [Arcobacter defluvii]BAK74310.1 hypothetical protein ABLL_2435 [Arcobacter sp. L]